MPIRIPDTILALIAYRTHIVMIAALLVSGCKHEPKFADCTEMIKEITPFSDGFDGALSDDWKTELDTDNSVALQFVTTPTRLGGGALKFNLKDEDIAAKANRAEIKLLRTEGTCTEIYYGWSFMVPTDYVDEGSLGFQIMGQFHDTPNFAAGETFNSFDSRSPLISLQYEFSDGAAKVFIRYGPQGDRRDSKRVTIQKGVWNDITLHIFWSQGDDGYLEATINGAPFLVPPNSSKRFQGPNMSNDQPPYFKIGLYRKDTYNATNNVFYDEVRIGTSLQAVTLP